MPKIAANGAEFYFELEGQGDPLILISGYTCDHGLWDPVVEMLRQHFRVLAFDNRAVGQTTDQGQALSIALMGDDVMALAEKLELKKPHIVGQSMGGTIAQSIGSRYSDRIGKVALTASSFKWRTAVLMAMESLLNMRRQNLGFDLIFKATLPWIFGENFLRHKDNVETLKQAFLQDPHPQSLENQERQFEVLKHFDGTKELSSIRAPTLIIHGKEDVLVLPYEAKYMEKHIPHAKLAQCACAHALAAEQPEEFAHLLISFMT